MRDTACACCTQPAELPSSAGPLWQPTVCTRHGLRGGQVEGGEWEGAGRRGDKMGRRRRGDNLEGQGSGYCYLLLVVDG